MSFSFNFQLDGDPGGGALGNSMASPELAKSEVSAAAPPLPPSGAESNPARLLVLDVPGTTLDESYASAEVRVAPNATSSRQIDFLVADPDRIRLPSNLAEAINGAKVIMTVNDYANALHPLHYALLV